MGIVFESLTDPKALWAHVGIAAGFVSGLASAVEHLPDADLASTAADIETLGRLVDALRVRVAGEVDHRSRASLAPEERLSQRHSSPSAGDLLAYATRAARREVQARIRLDRRTRPGTTLTGDRVPAPFPIVATALREGALGLDAAHTITDALSRVRDRGVARPDDIAAAEESIVAMATGRTPPGVAPALTHDDVRAVATLWADALDQDGLEPDAEYAERHRVLSLGRPRDGLCCVGGIITTWTTADGGFRCGAACRTWPRRRGATGAASIALRVRPPHRSSGAARPGKRRSLGHTARPGLARGAAAVS